MMDIEINNDNMIRLKKASKILGIKSEELLNRALVVYLDEITKHLRLKKEMKDWDLLSDEALLNFEKSI